MCNQLYVIKINNVSCLCRTTSNYQRPVHQGVPASQTLQLAESTPLTYPSALIPQTSDDSLEVWNVNLYESLTGEKW